MKASTILAYLFGRREAILEVAANRAALWTGIVLVLLTSIARNYDQTHITEKPFLWLFGSLLFSLVSGTWVFVLLDGVFVFKERSLPEADRTSHWDHWPQFMALFWMTAPIAWLYALPVERFLDSLTAAKANVALLAIVSFWRVVLMARSVQMVMNVPYWKSLASVLAAASVEVIVITFFGGTSARRIMAGMSGMRNSPEEEVLLGAMSFAFGLSLWIGVMSLIAMFARPSAGGRAAWPPWVAGRIPYVSLAIFTAAWVAIAIPAQKQVARNAHVEQLVSVRDYRGVLDYLGRHQPGDFAPGRTLPPKAYEREVFEELPRLFAVLEATDPEWVRRHCLTRLDQMLTHFRWFHGAESWERMSRTDQIDSTKDGILRRPIDESQYLQIIHALNRIPEGKPWLKEHEVFAQGLAEASSEQHVNIFRVEGKSSWKELEQTLEGMGHTNQTRRIELGHEPAPVKPESNP